MVDLPNRPRGGADPPVTLLAVNVDFLKLSSTPLQLLLVILAFVVVFGLVILFVTQLFGHQVDRKWPATEPLDATELLWGEMGGYVQGAFKGLDLDVSKSLISQMTERKVPAGAMIVSQGDPATHFYVLKKGTAEVLQRDASGRDNVIRQYGEGASFGEVAILQRSTRTASVRAVGECVLLELPAADYVAAAAVSAFHGNDLFAVVQ
ncbi:MAG: cAMP-dependent protein kinase regulator, partial [Acidimicrobiaceae bacterium]|nr:cAMP-dependent protein kinase regulator [Acidimicrobiaceae bacterium]